jgi:hypothetical protein
MRQGPLSLAVLSGGLAAAILQQTVYQSCPFEIGSDPAQEFWLGQQEDGSVRLDQNKRRTRFDT